MLADVVVDTNVLVQAGKAMDLFGVTSERFVAALRARTTSICVDDGFNTEEAKNRSVVGYEYLTHLRAGSVGFDFLMYMAQTGRIRVISKQVDAATGKRINRAIMNRKDRTFLRVTLNSDEKVLVSHDYADFSQNKRDTFCADLGALVCSAEHAYPIVVEE